MLKAASEGRPKLLELEELLVNKRVDANFVNQEGFCALHSATFNGHLLSVKMLLRSVHKNTVLCSIHHHCLTASCCHGMTSRTAM